MLCFLSPVFEEKVSMMYVKEFDVRLESLGRRIDAVNAILQKNVLNRPWVNQHWGAVRNRLVKKLNWMLECRLSNLRETHRVMPYRIRRTWYEPHAFEEGVSFVYRWMYKFTEFFNSNGDMAADLESTQRLKDAYESVRKTKIEYKA